MEKRIAVIGGGWYGCHIALALKKKHPRCEVVIFEKNSEIINEISGNFGIRLHAGPHYPRSPATRIECHKGFMEFIENYEELINEHKYSIYGLGNIDANGECSKVDRQTFASVCNEFGNSNEINPQQWNYTNIDYAANLNEPSIVVGPRLRDYFRKHLTQTGVRILSSTSVISVKKEGRKVLLETENLPMLEFDNVINASGFKSILPTGDLPMNMEVVYQICSALIYKRSAEFDVSLNALDEKPFSFIVMDGWFPCVMPYDDRAKNDVHLPISKYLLTHAKWTILGSYRTLKNAEKAIGNIDRNYIEDTVRNICEKEINQFFPNFIKEFEYEKLIMTILPKIKTDKEFRSSVTFQDMRNEVIHIIPGKINNIFQSEREVLLLLGMDTASDDGFVNEGHWCYVKGGTLDDASMEIQDKHVSKRNTCTLQAYKEIVNIIKNLN